MIYYIHVIETVHVVNKLMLYKYIPIIKTSRELVIHLKLLKLIKFRFVFFEEFNICLVFVLIRIKHI
jgi:hypothetical protein